MPASPKYRMMGQRVPTYDPDESWLSSMSAWVFPSPFSASSGGSRYSSVEDTNYFAPNDILKQPLLAKKLRTTYCSSTRILLVVALLIALLAAGLMTMYPCPIVDAINKRFKFVDMTYSLKTSSSQEMLFQNRNFTIALLGDSLINKPFNDFELAEKVQAYLPGYNLNIINCGSNGAMIASIKESLIPECVTPAKPDAVLIFWDSDVSDVNENVLSDTDRISLRLTYEANLASALNTLIKTGAYVAVAGPGVLGEGHRLFAPDQDRFDDKEGMLDDYKAMNVQAAKSAGIPYIDIRQAFLDFIPSYQLCYSLCVTYDGEHENERGTVIVARLFASSLSQWLSTLKP